MSGLVGSKQFLLVRRGFSGLVPANCAVDLLMILPNSSNCEVVPAVLTRYRVIRAADPAEIIFTHTEDGAVIDHASVFITHGCIDDLSR